MAEAGKRRDGGKSVAIGVRRLGLSFCLCHSQGPSFSSSMRRTAWLGYLECLFLLWISRMCGLDLLGFTLGSYLPNAWCSLHTQSVCAARSFCPLRVELGRKLSGKPDGFPFGLYLRQERGMEIRSGLLRGRELRFPSGLWLPYLVWQWKSGVTRTSHFIVMRLGEGKKGNWQWFCY